MKKLENIRIASPCRANWDDMIGDDRVRNCAACAKPVFNLSEMTLAEAEAVIAKHNGDLCVQLYYRADGTIMLADCTVATVGMRARNFVVASALALGTAYAKLHRGEQAEAASITTAIDGDVLSPTVELTTHEAPPPPPHPRTQWDKWHRAADEANRKRKHQLLIRMAGGSSFETPSLVGAE